MPRLVQEGGYGYTGCMCLCRRIHAELREARVHLNARDAQPSRCFGLVSMRVAHDPLDGLALKQMQIGCRLGCWGAVQSRFAPMCTGAVGCEREVLRGNQSAFTENRGAFERITQLPD